MRKRQMLLNGRKKIVDEEGRVVGGKGGGSPTKKKWFKHSVDMQECVYNRDIQKCHKRIEKTQVIPASCRLVLAREHQRRADIARELRTKIEALTLAALNPELLENGVHGYILQGTPKIETCSEEALALVKALADGGEHQ